MKESQSANELQEGSELSFFAGIPEEEHQLLLEKSVRIRKRAGGYLFREGDAIDRIWVIQSGRVKLSHVTGDGSEQIIGIFSTDEAIWEGVFLRNSRYPFSAVCLTPATVYAIDIAEFRKLLQEHVSLSAAIITLLSRKLHDANARARILATKDPMARTAGMLIYNAERTDGSTITLTLEDMAASISLRIETVSRKLRLMEQQKLIRRLGKGKVQIIDYAGIRRIYEGG